MASRHKSAAIFVISMLLDIETKPRQNKSANNAKPRQNKSANNAKPRQNEIVNSLVNPISPPDSYIKIPHKYVYKKYPSIRMQKFSHRPVYKKWCKAIKEVIYLFSTKRKEAVIYMITKMGMPFGGLKKAGFTGSYQGMRFFVKAFEEDTITAFVYPEPNSFDNTDDADKQSKKFPYTHEGVDECIDWLNETYEAQKEKWDNALTNKNNDR